MENPESQSEEEAAQKSEANNTDITSKSDSDNKIETKNTEKKANAKQEKETGDIGQTSNKSKDSVVANAFMQLSYGQKVVCVGNFWDVFCQEAINQGISPASFATFLGARAAIPGPSAPQGAWGQYGSGNRSVLDTFRKLRFGKLRYLKYYTQ